MFTVDTPGCQIPFVMIDFKKDLKADKKTKRLNCEKRAVFLKKIDENTVQASINIGVMKKYLRKSARFECCYRFFQRSTQPGHEHTKLK